MTNVLTLPGGRQRAASALITAAVVALCATTGLAQGAGQMRRGPARIAPQTPAPTGQTTVQPAQLPPAPEQNDHPTTSQAAAAAGQETLREVTVSLPLNTQLITIDYLRMHQPSAVARLATMARQGQIPPEALTGLGSPDFVQQTIAADWSDVLSTRRPAANTRLVRPRASEDSAGSRMGGAAASGEGSDTEGAVASRLAQLYELDAPGTVDLGEIMVGERRRQVIPVVAMSAGTLSVTPAPGALVRVVAMRGDTGMIATTLAPGGGRAAQMRSEGDVNQAPWRMRVTAGERVDLIVGFDPSQADGFDGSPTPYQTSFTVNLAPSGHAVREGASPDVQRVIRVKSQVSGLLYGIGLSYPQPLYAVDGLQAMIPYDLDNAGEAGQATITLKTDDLPVGLSVAGPTSFQVQLGAGEHRDGGAFVLNVPPQYYSSRDPVLTVLVTQATSKGTRTSAYRATVEVLPYTLISYYEFGGPADPSKNERVESYFVLQGSGVFQWTGFVDNVGCTHVDYHIELPAGGHLFTQDGRAGNNNVVTGSNPFWGPNHSTWDQSGIEPELGRYFTEIATNETLKPGYIKMTCYPGVDLVP